MNIEFHYYITYYLCIKAGFSEQDSHIIAYSSQFVDSSIISYAIQTEQGGYKTVVTQNYGFWDDFYPKNVYIPFHFFPGDNDGSTRKDNRKNPLNCTPNSRKVKDLLIAALRTRNLYRIGIGVHTFADTYAHQNFTGTLDPWNVFDETSFIPSIGHAQALTLPDDFAGTWEDPRLKHGLSIVSNRERFLQAADRIYRYLCTYCGRPFDDSNWVLSELIEITVPGRTKRTKEERILDLIIAYSIPRYDRNEWLKEALVFDAAQDDEELFAGYDKLLWLKDRVLYSSKLVKKEPIPARETFYTSHLYKWNEAAAAHRAEAFAILKDIV